MNRTLPLLGVTLALLTGCSAGPSAPATLLPRYDTLAQVPLQPGDTPEQLAQAVGGTVLSWPAPDCTGEDCTALVGLNTPSRQGLRALGGRSAQLEPNRDVFGGGGTITARMNGSLNVWSGGSLNAWSGGSLNAWSGGSYTPLPENTAIWQKVGLERAHAMARNLGAGVTVAVIDSGIDLAHPAFAGTLTAPSTWRDFYSGDAVPQEEGVLGQGAYGHGTNVAGIVLQVAPRARILPLRVLGPDGSGDVVMVAQAISYAAQQGARIINLSLGSDENSPTVQDAVRRAAEQGVMVVSSAGNSNLERITSPAALAEAKGTLGQNLLSVGSVDLRDLKSSFSNYAENLEMVAPGEQVASPAPGGRVAAWSGTSMAAPMVAGGLALALGESLTVSVKDLTKKMAESAFDVYNNGANSSYKDRLGVKGRLDLPEFLKNVIRY
ncbi:S8 family serine peptidase [Deinococcus arcticus]|uniref:Peptidase S8 and S53 subtilisin kexin sedolisin n=1 Tax=Deinococcus arcticus TaxID=2136176 RepID=A0A2T3WCY9_9DEIO|nr:S8 family serine peptidase [Deinococcus arcticus]PTA69702.1 peptidase S8 and S53 subtilisin kexin sedolisin [Deinococcus arcticus]